MEFRDVAMPSRTLFNLDEYTNECPGLLIALNSKGEAIGYVQIVSGMFYFYATCDGEAYEDYISMTELLDSNPAIDTFKLLEFNNRKQIIFGHINFNLYVYKNK